MCEAAGVVRVRVRHDERVDALDLPRTEERLHQRGARIEVGAGEAARVDDDHAAAPELDHRGVPLPDVEERRARRCAHAHARPPGCVDRQRDETAGGDQPTMDMLIGRMEASDKAAWMLRSHLEKGEEE
jgi:hypothetical protein